MDTAKIPAMIEILRRIADDLQAVLTEEKEPQEDAPNHETASINITLEDVRAVLAEKARAGHTAEVKALLIKHGADRISRIDEAKYPELLADAEALG